MGRALQTLSEEEVLRATGATSLAWNRPRADSEAGAELLCSKGKSLEATPVMALSGVSTLLVHALAPSAPGAGRCIVLIRETGIWESSEHLPIFEAVTGSRVIDAARMGYQCDTLDDAISLVMLLVAFGWGFSVYHEGARGAVHVDHDGAVWLTDAPFEEAIELERKIFH